MANLCHYNHILSGISTMWLIFLFILLLFCAYTGLFLVYKRGWNKIPNTKSATFSNPKTGFTVIVPARNEEDNIHALLVSILDNQYPKNLFEIIVVDDFSEDSTASIVQSFKQENIRLLSLSGFLSPEERINAYKKKALEIAIDHAQYDWIITTDADCIVSKNWLKTIDSYIQSNHQLQLIAAPVSFIPFDQSNTLYYFQSLDFMTMQGITAASVYYDLGSMANGANFIFSIDAYKAVDGYKGIDHIASGDDMLLMQKIRAHFPESIAYLKDEQAIVYTKVQENYRSFLNQRIRWASKSGAYQEWKLKASLLIVYLFNLSFPILLIVGICNKSYLLIALLLLILKTLIELYFIKDLAQFFKKQNELKHFPLLQPLHIIYVISAGFLGLFGSYEWKGRKVK